MLTPLVVSLTLTVAALAVTVWTGSTGRRRAHYASVVAFLALLALAIRFAEQYGTNLVYDGLANTLKRIHFVGVAITFALVPLLVVTGVRLARATPEQGPSRRSWHRVGAVVFVLSTLITFGFGLAMTLAATPA